LSSKRVFDAAAANLGIIPKAMHAARSTIPEPIDFFIELPPQEIRR
jgi:hypothetical protein